MMFIVKMLRCSVIMCNTNTCFIVFTEIQRLQLSKPRSGLPVLKGLTWRLHSSPEKRERNKTITLVVSLVNTVHKITHLASLSRLFFCWPHHSSHLKISPFLTSQSLSPEQKTEINWPPTPIIHLPIRGQIECSNNAPNALIDFLGPVRVAFC
jgi:hypothetical protein